MTKKKLTEQLVILLDRTSYDLLLLVVTFLKKLSIYEENMAEVKTTQEYTSKHPYEYLIQRVITLIYLLLQKCQ